MELAFARALSQMAFFKAKKIEKRLFLSLLAFLNGKKTDGTENSVPPKKSNLKLADQLLFAVAAHIMMTMIATSSAMAIAIALLVMTALLIAPYVAASLPSE